MQPKPGRLTYWSTQSHIYPFSFSNMSNGSEYSEADSEEEEYDSVEKKEEEVDIEENNDIVRNEEDENDDA